MKFVRQPSNEADLSCFPTISADRTTSELLFYSPYLTLTSLRFLGSEVRKLAVTAFARLRISSVARKYYKGFVLSFHVEIFTIVAEKVVWFQCATVYVYTYSKYAVL